MDEISFNELMGKVEETQTLYATNTDKKIILTDTQTLLKYPYKTTSCERLYRIEDFGLTDRYFGGQAYKLAKVAKRPYLLIVNKFDMTIGIMIPIEWLKELTVPELKILCDKYKIEYSKEHKKDELIEMLKK
jgi:hypothetical protein